MALLSQQLCVSSYKNALEKGNNLIQSKNNFSLIIDSIQSL